MGSHMSLKTLTSLLETGKKADTIDYDSMLNGLGGEPESRAPVPNEYKQLKQKLKQAKKGNKDKKGKPKKKRKF